MTARPVQGRGLPGPEGDCLSPHIATWLWPGPRFCTEKRATLAETSSVPRCQDAIVALTPTSRTVVPPVGSDNPRSVDFPRWLIGGATSGRVRHVPAGAPKAGYFAAFFLRSAQ